MHIENYGIISDTVWELCLWLKSEVSSTFGEVSQAPQAHLMVISS